MKKLSNRPAVEVKDLHFSYGAKEILSLPKLTVAQGSHTLICGDSGCGKSTLMNLIAGVLGGYSGTLKVLGQEQAELSASARDRFRAQHIAVIFQQFNLIPYLSVTDNIRLALSITGRIYDTERVASILAHLQIDTLAKQKARELSHGQQQRVAAARALAIDAGLILADEPTSALDERNSRLFLDLLFREAELNQRTVVVVSHDLRQRRRFDQVIDLTHVNRVKAAHSRGAA